MAQLRAAGIVSGDGRALVNGKEMTTAEAAGLSDRVETIEALDGVVAVVLTRVREESCDDFKESFKVTASLRSASGRKTERFRPGDRAQLVVTLDDGYKCGDLLHAMLPACMAWMKGGGRVRQLTLDFEGKDEIVLPLIVLSKIEGAQRFAVCVRNMFEKERGANPGLLTIKPPIW